MKTTNENLVNNSNQHQNGQNLVDKVDKLIIERLPFYLSEEIKWICEEYGDEVISEYLCSDDYYKESKLLNYLDGLYSTI
jgi:hypothetical protein